MTTRARSATTVSWWTSASIAAWLVVGCSTSMTMHTPKDTDTDTDAEADTDTDVDTDTDTDVDTDTDTDSDTGAPVVVQTTIHDIQQGAVPEGTVVAIQGVVSATAPEGLYVQEVAGGPFSGIWVYGGKDWATGYGAADRGDQVRITGVYLEYYDLSEIALPGVSGAGLQNLGSGAEPRPEPVSGADLGEDWESVLVEVANLVVDDPDLGYGEFSAADATGSSVIVDDQIHRFGPLDNGTLTAGFRLERVAGPLNYSFGDFMIEPRDAADVVPGLFVYDVQQGAIAEGNDVTLTGVIVTAVGPEGVFVQEAAGGEYSGIYVYLGTDWETFWGPLALGDVVDLAGQYLEFYGRSEISVPTGYAPGLAVVGTAPVPAPEVLTAELLSDPASADPWEGVLVQVLDVVVQDPALIGFEFSVVDEAAPGGALVIDDALHLYGGYDTLAAGQAFSSITGTLDHGWSTFALEPRDAADLVP